jgi:hypothetical protein
MERLGLASAQASHLRAELARPRVVVVDERLEEIEDDRPDQIIQPSSS